MRYEVVLTRDAESDLEHIYRYVAEHDSKASADHVLERLLEVSDSLRSHPGARSDSQGTAVAGDHGVLPGALQTLSADFSNAPQLSRDLSDRRWAARYAIPSPEKNAGRLRCHE